MSDTALLMHKLKRSDNINHRLVYDIVPYITSMQNARGKAIEANKKVKEKEEELKYAIIKCSGLTEDQLIFSNVGCMANGIHHHVYKRGGPDGSGANKCIFCSCDDFDGL